MLPERRYADWRLVAVRRVPAEWIGVGAGLLTGLVVTLAMGKPSYLTYLAGIGVAHWAKGRLVERRMHDLRDDPDGGQFAVNLRLSREVSYGYDEGLVAFVDGWLVYSGRRCGFSVRRSDVRRLIAKDKQTGFAFSGEAGEHEAIFTGAEGGRLQTAIREWSRAEGVPGEAVLPPTQPNEEARRLHRSWLTIGAAISVLLVFTAFVSHKSAARTVETVLATLLLPTALVYGFEAQRALDRIASRLPHLPNRFTGALGFRSSGDATPGWNRHEAGRFFRDMAAYVRESLRPAPRVGSLHQTSSDEEPKHGPQRT